MRLQIKRLDGPDEIKLSTNTNTSYAAAVSTSNAERKFTCYFNRALRNTDIFPTTVTVKVYNDQGNEQNTFSLIVNRNNVNDANANANFCFTITLNCPQILTGSYFHVHAVLLNTDTNAENITYGVSSYHQTIKKVYIYDDKEFLEIYWSSSEPITYEEEEATQESLREGNIGQNEDAFLHIKTKGMYKDNIAVILTADNDSIILRSTPMRMKQNRRVVAFDMAEVIQRYRQRTEQLEGDVTFNLKAWIAANDMDNTSRIAILPSASRGMGNTNLPFSTANMLIRSEALRILPISGVNQMTPLILDPSGELTVTCTDSDPALKRTSTGTVYVQTTSSQLEDVTPTKFTDFKIGYIGHLEGIGDEAYQYNIAANRTKYSVYLLQFYEIKVSDLLVSNIITIEDAILLGTESKTRQQLETEFNKTSTLITQVNNRNRTLLSLFQEANNNNRVNRSIIRKLLAFVKAHQPVMSYNMCRDAWQKVSKGEIQRRTQVGRYNTNKECPPTEYFLNWSIGTYRVYPSQYAEGAEYTDVNRVNVNPVRNIDQYHNINNDDRNRRRQGIALHNGGPNASTGCITFNIGYYNEGRENGGINTPFHNFIRRVYTENGSQVYNSNFLSFLCIDERNAIQLQNDISGGINYWRFYDLVEP